MEDLIKDLKEKMADIDADLELIRERRLNLRKRSLTLTESESIELLNLIEFDVDLHNLQVDLNVLEKIYEDRK